MLDKVLRFLGLRGATLPEVLKCMQEESGATPKFHVPKANIVPAAEGTWRALVAKRKKLQEMAAAEGAGFEVNSYLQLRTSGSAKTRVGSFLTSSRDVRGQDLVLVVENRDEYRSSAVALNYDEALALYRGLVPLFGDRATCAGCANVEKLLFSGLQVWCPRCKLPVTLMGDTPKCPRCAAEFTRDSSSTSFLRLPEKHNTPSAVPPGSQVTQ